MITALFIIYGIALIALGLAVARAHSGLAEKKSSGDFLTRQKFYFLLDSELDIRDRDLKRFVEERYAHKRKSRKPAGAPLTDGDGGCELSSFNGDELTPEPTNG